MSNCRLRILATLLPAVVGTIGCAAMPVEMEGLSIDSAVLGHEVKYSVILPDGYFDSTEHYPVIYMFHGIGGDHSSWLEYGNTAAVADNLCKEGLVAPFIMVMPDGYMSYYNDAADGSLDYEQFLIKELIAEIDSDYRTIRCPEGRATLGFSMGGFGALSVALRHPELFHTAIGLSPSIRTDEQYCSEGPQEDWDRQWGRTFGAEGKKGPERLTDYYKDRSPYHILESKGASGIDIFIEIGDEEGTLCESNERLHRMMVEKNIPHHWAVIDGGHDFDVWNASLPRAMCFANGSLSGIAAKNTANASSTQPQIIDIDGARVYLPPHDSRTNRQWPSIFLTGCDLSTADSLYSDINSRIKHLQTAPVVLVALDSDKNLAETVRTVEDRVPSLRDSQRMRTLIVCNASANSVIETNKTDNLFTAIVLSDAIGTTDDAIALTEAIKDHGRYPRLYIQVDPASPHYDFASELHILLQKAGKKHEFRTSGQGVGDFPLWLDYLMARIHI